MKKIALFLAVFLVVLSYIAHAQDNPLKSFYFETGMDFMICNPPDDKDYIRGDVNPLPVYYESSYVMALMYKNYVGFKCEKRALNNKLGLLSGVRFTRIESSIGRNNYWSTGADFLYLLYNQEGTTTEYLKVKDISQVTQYLGIPLELRIYPYEERKVQMYYKIAADINFLLKGKSKVTFHDPEMNSYSDAVGRIIEDPWKVYATVYAAVGMKIGASDKPGINIEACFPSAVICNYNSSFVEPSYGGGFQINIRFPL